MSPTQKKRLTIVTLVLLGMGIATALGLMAVKSSIEYFRTPSQIHSGEFNLKQTFKIAGLVKKGSLLRMEDGVTQRFTITDCEQDVVVQYTGILPDLFREGQAIVTVGKFTSEPLLIAQQVLAKHDENYVPSEAADAVMLAQANKCDSADGAVKY
jgi:cytochrome c-type biogenesis protein CcmE